jgi:hypothetical protein
MQVKNESGGYSHVTSMGQGNLNTVLGSLGTASFFGLNANNILGGLAGNNRQCACPNPSDVPVTRYEAEMMLALNAKDGEIALLKADKYTDQKISEATAYLMGKIGEVSAEVRANKDAQCAVNAQQLALNAASNATIACLQGQVAQLFGITKLVVPNSSVCPGWGNVNTTPATTPAAA